MALTDKFWVLKANYNHWGYAKQLDYQFDPDHDSYRIIRTKADLKNQNSLSSCAIFGFNYENLYI